MIKALPGTIAPKFAGVAAHSNGKFSDISMDELLSKEGQWLLLFFYPLDFGYISPSELMELNKIKGELDKLKCQIIACSTDSAVTHEKFLSVPPSNGGVQGIEFPLLEDVSGSISENYGVLRDQSGYTFRAYFVIDNNGFIRSRTVCDLPIGLGTDEIVGKVESLQKAQSQENWLHE